MKPSYIALAAIGLALVTLYFAIPHQTPPAAPSTTTAQHPSTTSSQPEQVAQTQTAAPPITHTPPKTTTQTTPTQTPAGAVRYVPVLGVEVRAPDVVNTTRLPAAVNYTVVLTNTGNGTAWVKVENSTVEIRPGGRVLLNFTTNITSAGVYKVGAKVNGTMYEKKVVVYYYAPLLTADPVFINVTKLPADATVVVRVRNVGNWTGRVLGVEVKPGSEAMVNTTIKVDAAGSYVLQIDGVEVPVSVQYLAPSLKYLVGGPKEVEAVPGESVSAWIWLKNEGNATAAVRVNGRPLTIKPGQYVNITKNITVTTSGSYTFDFNIAGDLNVTAKYTTAVKIVAAKVQIVVWTPQLLRSWPLPNSTDTMALSFVEKSASITWGYIIETNATSRSVVLQVADPQGVYYHTLSPGQKLARNFTLQVQAPTVVTLQLAVNNTAYAVEVDVKLSPPRITINDISEIEFSDSRKLLSVPIKCRYGSASATLQLDVVKVEGVLRYLQDGREVRGTITVNTAGDTYTGDFKGSVRGTSGQATINVAGRRVDVEFTTSPLEVRRVLIDGTPYDCDVPTALIPAVLISEKPTAKDEPADQLASRLVSIFAKSDFDKPRPAIWNGEYVEVIDRARNLLKVYFRQGEVLIEGALTAKFVIS
ncbi:MAG: hypothetical protein ABWK05_09625 [Pyrobaculum sp.]